MAFTDGTVAGTKRLRLVFENSEAKTSSIYIPNPNDNITEQQIKDLMDGIVSLNLFFAKSGDSELDLVTPLGAEIITTEKTTFDLVVE